MARRHGYYDYYNTYYTPSRPKEAKGGIRSQSKRGGFGKSWWARRWIAVLEGFNIGARLQRGRSYARQGQVVSIHIEKGKVSAQVQGSRARPYKVEIRVKTIPDTDWQRVADALRTQALFAAKLCAGEMPEDIEEVFQKARLSLFPSKMKDLETECSCPDWSNPCKHIAAVFYLLGEEFDRDPFLIFRMRGMEREGLLGLIGAGEKEKGEPSPGRIFENGLKPACGPGAAPSPLSDDPESFWGKGEGREDLFGEVSIPQVAASLPKRLGKFPLWQGEAVFMDALEEIYKRASLAGMDAFIGSNPTMPNEMIK